MSTDTPTGESGAEAGAAGESTPSRAELAARVTELETELAEVREEAAAAKAAREDSQKVVIVATDGTLDGAYPPLILASTAAAFGYDVTVFYTFWGLEVLHEEHAGDLSLSPVGNPNLGVPDAVGILPGVDAVATRMMRRKIDAENVATVAELIQTSLDTGVDLQACQMTMDLFDYEEDDFFDGVTTGVGAATAFQEMADADVQLLV
ncbi:DsrE/DsrF/DrsH-like family protein [Halobaculum sp. MBLA0143]|uniref:DsrE/DsrF/DrsH-like family protein n=1 Tax=Halobaculum sp. MBLA0143 TaxID=3079933 RepID=UPI003526A46F